MIQAKDLRIGNWVEAVGDKWEKETNTKAGDYIQVGVYDLSHIQGCNKRGEQPSHASIPLTPEILLKCGFEYGKTGKKKDDSFTQFWDIKTPQHPKNFGSWTFTIVRWWRNSKPEEFVFSHHNMRTECKFIHQLQNLYFALTGTELNYKP